MTAEAESIVPTEITVLKPPAPLAIRTPRALIMQQALEEEREQRLLLRQYVNEFMVEGEDYGTIPGVKKKSLFKPGAEKLTDLFRCRPEYEIMAKEVNHETGLFYYEIRCRAVNRETNTVLNEGVGSASSYESKYRYRNADRACPKCGSPSIKKSKFPPRGSPQGTEPGWYCYAKVGGCGAEFPALDPTIEGQVAGKVQNPDLADVANVVLKMAKKRAQVDCALALARVSDMFTQDVEDMVEAAAAVTEHRATPAAHAPATAPVAPRPHAPVQTSSNAVPGVALLERAQKAGKTFKEIRHAAVVTMGKDGPPAPLWTEEQTKKIEAILFPPADAAEPDIGY